jgi:hypothetical protein
LVVITTALPSEIAPAVVLESAAPERLQSTTPPPAVVIVFVVATLTFAVDFTTIGADVEVCAVRFPPTDASPLLAVMKIPPFELDVIAPVTEYEEPVNRTSPALEIVEAPETAPLAVTETFPPLVSVVRFPPRVATPEVAAMVIPPEPEAVIAPVPVYEPLEMFTFLVAVIVPAPLTAPVAVIETLAAAVPAFRLAPIVAPPLDAEIVIPSAAAEVIAPVVLNEVPVTDT